MGCNEKQTNERENKDQNGIDLHHGAGFVIFLLQNNPDLPELKIFSYSGDQKRVRGSVRRSEKRYLVLLGDPLFYHPCYPLRGYMAVLRAEKKNGVMSFRKPDEFIPQIAERAYFYVSMLHETSAIFLKYIQDGILKNYLPG